MTTEVVLKTLKRVWRHLEPLNLPMAVMGGLALSVWKHYRATRDVDLLVNLEASAIDPVLTLLQQAGFRLKRHPPVLQLGPVRLIQLLYEPPDTFIAAQVDLLLAESEYAREALTRRVAAQLPGLDVPIYVLSCEDLILHKLLAGRIIDRADAATLLRVNRASLDFGYLQGWLARLALQAEWSEIWREAFPGEEAPSASTPPKPAVDPRSP
jgi:hypothetical protein